MLVIYTDGSCSKNGSINNNGGFGVVVVKDEHLIATYSKMSQNTTNNKEELKAILYALIQYGDEPNVVVYSDSNYCVNTFTKWMYSWQRNGWKKADNKTPENLDLIKTYYDLTTTGERTIDLRKIQGHSGHIWNELADQLATGKISPEEAMKKYG